MAVFRVEKTKDFTIMSNYHLRDKNLSLKAKGLLSQMLSLPEEWDYTLAGLAHINKESKDAIRTAILTICCGGIFVCSTEIRTDETMRSTISYGTPEHPICCITDDLGKLESQSTRWHWHDELEFSLVTRGRVTFYAEAQQFALEAGDALYISSGTIHHVEGTAGCVVENLIFSPSYLGSRMSPVLQKYVEPVLHRGPSMLSLRQNDGTSAPIIACLKEVLRIWAQKQPLWELSILSGVLELWKAFYPQAAPYFKLSQNKQHELTRIRLQTMMAYIAQHYAELIPLEQIADAAHISSGEALRCFQAGLQTTPVQYLIDYRLSTAQHRLLASSDSVTRIAADCGFHATGYFCRMFRKKYGMTPVEFRKVQKQA